MLLFLLRLKLDRCLCHGLFCGDTPLDVEMMELFEVVDCRDVLLLLVVLLLLLVLRN